MTVEADPHRYDNIILDNLNNTTTTDAIKDTTVDPTVFQLETYDSTVGSSDLEFAKGIKAARKTSSLGKEQLLQDFTKKNTFSVGDFGTGSGVAY